MDILKAFTQELMHIFDICCLFCVIFRYHTKAGYIIYLYGLAIRTIRKHHLAIGEAQGFVYMAFSVTFFMSRFFMMASQLVHLLGVIFFLTADLSLLIDFIVSGCDIYVIPEMC